VCVVCGIVWSGFGGVSVCCVRDGFGVDLGGVSVCCVWDILEWIGGSECVLFVGMFGVDLGE